jgi:DNA polymerase-1
MRTPHVILTADELRDVARGLDRETEFVIDLETTSARRDSEMLWIGIGTPHQRHLIPIGHPKGVLIEGTHKEKEMACRHYPSTDKRHWTPITNKPSLKMVEYTVEARYAPPPKQMSPPQAVEILRPIIYSERKKIGHNVKFDLMTWARYNGGEIPPPPYADTMLIEHCLDEGYGESIRPFGLKELIYDEFSVLPEKRQQFYPSMGKAGVVNFGLDQVARYLTKDLHWAWYVYKTRHKRLKAAGVLDAYRLEMDLYPAIMGMEYHGFTVDLTQIGQVQADLEADIQRIEKEVWEITGGQFPLSNLDAKRWVLFGEGEPVISNSRPVKVLRSQNLPVISRTPKQQAPKVTQEVLESFSDKGNDLASLLLEWSTQEKLRGTFIGHPRFTKIDPDTEAEVEVDPTGIYRFLVYLDGKVPTLHTSFKQHGTKTGRLSASEPNLQQLPKGSTIRQLFVAPKGRTLVVADYDQIELRCVGFLSRDPAMLEVFGRGEDIHRRAASVMYRVAPEKVTGDQRSVGKHQNFATLYGAGKEKIAQVARISEQRAAALIRNYYSEFRGLEPWKRKVLLEALAAGNKFAPDVNPPYVLIPPFGRRRRIPDLSLLTIGRLEKNEFRRLRRAERQAVNAKVQGFAAAITKMAMIELEEQLKAYPAHMVAQVHDEIVVDCDEGAADEVSALMNSVMSGVLDPSGDPVLGAVPLVVSVAYGYTWAEAKGKG